MSKKQITELSENFLKSLDKKLSSVDKKVVVEKNSVQKIEEQISIVNRKLTAARVGGIGNISKLAEEKSRLHFELHEAKKISAKDIKNALASDSAKAKPKDKVSLKKAPWDEETVSEEPAEMLAKKVKDMDKKSDKKPMPPKEDMKENDMSGMVCKECGDEFGKPKTESCGYDSHDEMGENWVKKESYKEEMDPVNPKAVKKKFDDRKDKDIDNDGDVDSSDEYLHKRRKAISKALAKEGVDTSDEKKSELEEAVNDDDWVVVKGRKVVRTLKNPKNNKAPRNWQKSSDETEVIRISKAKKMGIIEVLDTPKAMDRYRNKAKYSKERAANSAAAKMLRNKDGFKSTDTSDELKTMDKRTKGLKMADRVVARKYRQSLRKEEVELEEQKTPYIVVDTADGNKVVGMASDERGAKMTISSAERPPMSIKDKSTLKIVKSNKKQHIGRPLKEDVELDEAKLDAYDFESMDPPKGIDYDAGNLRKVKWKMYDNAALKSIISRNDNALDDHGIDGKGNPLRKYHEAIIKAAKAELKKRGIKEDVDITELHMSLLEARGIEKKMAEKIKKVFDAMSTADKAAFMKAYLKNPKAANEYMADQIMKGIKAAGGMNLGEAMDTKAATEYMFKDMKKMAEEVELEEKYEINHKTFSAAVQHAKSQVEKKGYTIDDDEWDRKVAMGPRKPGSGKTNRYTIDLMKGGKETRRKLQMQVYYDEGRYELNMYVS